VWTMKIISWNIRGLGGMVKRKEVRKLVGEQIPSIVCLQETKQEHCDDFLCFARPCGEIHLMLTPFVLR
jgi:endonuclease/exonuclease/phosphatase family metal-dependent hydrolase